MSIFDKSELPFEQEVKPCTFSIECYDDTNLSQNNREICYWHTLGFNLNTDFKTKIAKIPIDFYFWRFYKPKLHDF